LIGSGKVTADKFAVLPAARASAPGDPGFFCVQQNIPNGSDTVIVWLGEVFDTAGLHVATTCVPPPDPLASRLTAPRAGIYQVDAGVKWGGDNGTGERFLGLGVNGTSFPGGPRVPAAHANGTGQAVSTLVSLNAGDYVEAVVFQSSGSDLYLQESVDRNFLEMHWVGPAS